MSVSWGVHSFENDLWTGNGLDTVYAFPPGSGGNMTASSPPYGIVTARPLVGTRHARGMIDTTQPGLYSAGALPTDNIYTGGDNRGFAVCAVHTLDPDAYSMTATLRMAFNGERQLGGLNPGYSDPDQWFGGSDPNNGSDLIEISLDSALDYKPADGIDGSPATVNYSAGPILSPAHANHSIVWPFRVRSDRSVSPAAGQFAGYNGTVSQDFTVLCESRVFKFTDSNNITQYRLYLVWYPDVASSDVPPVISSDYILLAVYSPSGETPTTATSPFFRVNSGAPNVVDWEEVEVKIDASLNGFVGMTITRLSDNYQEFLSITGQPAQLGGGTTAQGDPRGLTFFDVGCAFCNGTKYSALDYPNQGETRFSYIIDEISGVDTTFGSTTGGQVLFGESFSGIRDAHATAANNFGGKVSNYFFQLPESNFLKFPEFGSAVWPAPGPLGNQQLNWWGRDITDDAKNEVPIVLNSPAIYDAQGFAGLTTLGWSNQHLDSMIVSAWGIGNLIFGDDVEAQQIYPTPTVANPNATRTGKFGFAFNATQSGQQAHVAEVLLANANESSSYAYPNSNLVANTNYEYHIMVGGLQLVPGAAGIRGNQIELVLFGNETGQSDAGAIQGQGAPPPGLGLRVRTGGPGVVVDFFWESTTSASFTHPIVGLEAADVSQLIGLSVETRDFNGSDVEVRVTCNKRTFLTNAAGDGNQTIPKANIDSLTATYAAPGGRSVGLNAAGVTTDAEPKRNWFSQGIFPIAISCGSGGYQGTFHQRIDSSQAGYSDADMFANHEHIHDFATSFFDYDATSVDYLKNRSLRIAWNSATARPAANRQPFVCYSAIKPKIADAAVEGTITEPFPGMMDQALDLRADFPCVLDDDILSNRQPGKLVAYRGFTYYSKPDEWYDLNTITGSPVETATTGLANIGTAYIPKGISVLLWGNPSQSNPLAPGAESTDLKVQIIAVWGAGQFVASPLYDVVAGTTPQERHIRCRLVEVQLPAGSRRFELELYNQNPNTNLWNSLPFFDDGELGLTAGEFANFTDSEIAFWRFYKFNQNTGGNQQEINTTWMTGFQLFTSTASGSNSSLDYSAAVSVKDASKTQVIEEARGIMTNCPLKRLTNVRGIVEGRIEELPPRRRRLLVFNTDELGKVPGGFGHQFNLNNLVKNWYQVGVTQANGVWFGNGDIDYDDAQLEAHGIEISSIQVAGRGGSSMSIVQRGIHPFGGHLRCGQMVCYVEQVTGEPYEIDAGSGAVIGGGGIHVMFRGRIVTAQRDPATHQITYEAIGPYGLLGTRDVLELSNCTIGQVAFNVEPGSPNTPYAVSKNLNFGAEFVPQHSAENFGSILGLGIPDLTGMTIADIIEWLLNKWRRKFNSMGVLRLNSVGQLTVANADGSDVNFHRDSDLASGTNTAGDLPTFGPAETASIVWAPNRESYNIRPSETVVRGDIASIIDGVLSNLPDVRWRIEMDRLRWVFETRDSLPEITIFADEPGTLVNVSDDATDRATAALVSSPWQKQEQEYVSLQNGTLKPVWAAGTELDWSQQFAQIGTFVGRVESVQNFPYFDPNDPNRPPIQTVMVIRVDVGSEPLQAQTFNGVTCEILGGPLQGETATVFTGTQRGGYQFPYQYFDVVVEPAFPGGYGTDVLLEVGRSVRITDDPLLGTTNSANAYSRTFADYIVVDPNSGKPANNLLPGGYFNVNQPLGGCGADTGNLQESLPVNSAVIDGELVQSPVPLTNGGNSCAPGQADLPNSCGGDIVYSAIRVSEGTWCIRAPEEGFAGTAYQDIVQYEGIVTEASPDGRGFKDRNAAWKPGQWQPQGGARAKVLVVGGEAKIFDTADITPTTAVTDETNLNALVTQPFNGGWDVSPTDVDQSLQPLEQRAIDHNMITDPLAFYHRDTGQPDTWSQTAGIAWKPKVGSVGRARGAVITRFIPARYAGVHDFTPLEPGINYQDLSLNNNIEVEADLTLDLADAITSLTQTGIVLRAENGFVEQLRVPPNDKGTNDPYLLAGSAGSVSNVSTQAHMASENYRWLLGGVGPQSDAAAVDAVPEWISSFASPSPFKQGRSPSVTGSAAATYNGQNLLGRDGVVIDSRFSNNSDITSRYESDFGNWTITGGLLDLKRGLEHGTTGYVFRMVRGDEPDNLVGAGTTSDACYATVFWYHTRRAVDPATGDNVLDINGQPVYEGVKEIIFQSPINVSAANIPATTNLKVRFSVQQAPNSQAQRLSLSIDGLENFFAPISFQFNHDAREFLLRNGTESLPVNGFDGVYANGYEGFSMARGAGGFGYGIVKAPQIDSGGVGYTSVNPAKVSRFAVRKINQPYIGIAGNDLESLVALQFDDAQVGTVTENDSNSLRFDLETTQGSPPAIPRVGDRYRIILDRGWGIANMRVLTADGLDDPTKVWIFKHMADSALKETQDRSYSGSVTLQGTRYDLINAGLAVNLAMESAYTGLETARQPAQSVTFQFEGSEGRSRQTIVELATANDTFSRIDDLLAEEARKDSIYQAPSWLGNNGQLNSARNQQTASAGTVTTGISGFSGSNISPVCGDNVFVTNINGDNSPPVTVNEFLLSLENFFIEIKTIIQANKEGEGFDPGQTQQFTLGGGDGIKAEGGFLRGANAEPGLVSLVQSRLQAEGKPVIDTLVQDTKAVSDSDGQLYSMMIRRSASGEGAIFTWAAVNVDPNDKTRYVIDETKTGQKPRESGTAIVNSVIDGTANTYTVTSYFRSPVVQVVALDGYTGVGGAVAGDHLNANNCTGFKINESTTNPYEITISATNNFGPCSVYLSS